MKTVETRTYPLPSWLVGQEIIMIETPGRVGKFKQRMVAKIVFGEGFRYSNSKLFYADFERHQVCPDSPWAWKSGVGKWGWPIISIQLFEKPVPMTKRGGIVYAKDLQLPTGLRLKKA
jgi:hypothetical protein